MNDPEEIASATRPAPATDGRSDAPALDDGAADELDLLADTSIEEEFGPDARVARRDGVVEVIYRPADSPSRAGTGLQRIGKARNMPVEEAIVRRHLAGECGTEETLLEIYHAPISMHRAEAVARNLWGGRIGLAAIGTLHRKIVARTGAWRTRAIRKPYPYVFLGMVALKHRAAGLTGESAVLVAVGVNLEGYREVLGVAESEKRDGAGWRDFLGRLQRRGLAGVRLFISDPNREVTEAVREIFPEAAHQVCVRQLQRNILAHVPTGHLPMVTASLETIVASESRAAARQQTARLVVELRLLKLHNAATVLEQATEGMLRHYAFPDAHWKMLRSNFPLMRILRRIRERARVVGPFSDPSAIVLIVSARLRWVGRQWLAARSRLDMDLLAGADQSGGADVLEPRRAAG